MSDPTLDLSRTRHTDQATYELSEMNRARAQRWNSGHQGSHQASSSMFAHGSQRSQRNATAVELLRQAQQAGYGQRYSFADNATPLEKVLMYGVGVVGAMAQWVRLKV